MEDSIRMPRHVAVIMDGNGRWAEKNGVSRLTGHNQGMLAMKEIIKNGLHILNNREIRLY